MVKSQKGHFKENRGPALRIPQAERFQNWKSVCAWAQATVPESLTLVDRGRPSLHMETLIFNLILSTLVV